MSVPLAIDDVLQLTFNGVLFGQRIQSVINWRVESAPVGGTTAEVQLQDLAGWVGDKALNVFLQKYLNAATHDFTMAYVDVQRVSPTRTIFFRETIAELGVDVVDGLQANLAASIEKKTITVNRKGIGRLQFAPIPKDRVAGGFIDPGYSSVELQELADAMLGGITAGVVYTGTYRYCLPASVIGGAAYDLFDAFPQDTVRTMHRRTVGLGI